MKKIIKTILMLSSIAIISCNDIIEEDISDKTIITNTPAEGAIVEGTYVQFNWQELEEADQYNIQILDEQNVIILDSTTTSTILDYELEEHNYFWKVRGENFAYETSYSPLIGFTVIPFSDLEEQEVDLQTPVDQLSTNSITDFRFSWTPIESVAYYNFEILELETDKIIYSTSDITISEFSLDEGIITEDNDYKWQVRGFNSSSQTDFFYRTFSYDTQEPPMATLLSPKSTDTLNNEEEITFTWEYSDLGNSQTEIISVVEISPDDSFPINNILITDSKNTANTFTFTPTETGTYFWRVIGTDAAGNEGKHSVTGVFTVN